MRRWEHSKPLAWETWTDVPGSGAATRSYEVTGLRADTGYDYEVRPVVGTTADPASPMSRSGSTHRRGHLPEMSSDQIVQGDGVSPASDGRTEWQIGSFAFTIPDGMRLVMGLPYISADGSRGIPVYVHPDGGGLTFSFEGHVLARYVPAPAAGDATTPRARGLSVLLDQIVESLRRIVETYTLTLTPPANGVLNASPEARSYKPGATVTVTTTPKYGYELAARGGGCSSTVGSSATCTLTMNADRIVSATFAEVLKVITITTGDSGVVLLEWSGGPDNATRCQYRQRGPENDWVWTAWTDIPGSDASTRSYRLSGLRDSTVYHFEVRAVVGTVMGDPSEEVLGGTPVFDKHGIPEMFAREIVGGGRTWRVSAGLAVIDVPAGTRLMNAGGVLADTGQVIVTVQDVESGSRFYVDIGTAEVIEREIVAPQGPPAAGTSPRDVGAIFDRIAASARVLPP